MAVQAHLFVLDPISRLNLRLDSSLRLARAIVERGHKAYLTQGEHLSWHSSDGAAALAAPLSFPSADPSQAPVPGHFSRLPLKQVNAIHMRKDPPFDMDYVSMTWMLDAAPQTTRVYNRPEALRSINEKLAILMYPEFSRKALVSAHTEEILTFIGEHCHDDAVIKPLDLFGGRGVQRITFRDATTRAAAREVIEKETGAGKQFRLVQAFDNAVFEGEIRAFAAFGEPLSWCLKRPAAGNFLANTAAGAQLMPYMPKPEEVKAVRSMSQTLMSKGVTMVGFDMIGGYLSEMNITSPRLLVAPGDQTDYYGLLADRFIADTTS